MLKIIMREVNGEAEQVFDTVDEMVEKLGAGAEPLSIEDINLLTDQARKGKVTYAAIDPFQRDVHELDVLIFDADEKRLDERIQESRDNI